MQPPPWLLALLCAPLLLGVRSEHRCAQDCGAESAGLSLLQTRRQVVSRHERRAPAPERCPGGSGILMLGGLDSWNRSIIAARVLDAERQDLGWQRVPPLPAPSSAHGAVVSGSLVYVMGGNDNSGTDTQALRLLDAAQHTWQVGPPMPVPRAFPATAVVGGRIYAMGGVRAYPHDVAAVSADVFDTSAQQWQATSALPAAYFCATAVAYGHSVYLMAGGTSRVDVLDTRTGLWRAGPPSPAARTCATAQRVGRTAYLFGGYDDRPPHWPLSEAKDNAWMLDLSAEQWTVLPPMPTPVAVPSSVVQGEDIYIIGGETMHLHHVNTVSIFDTATRTWRAGPSLPANISDFAAVVPPQC